MAKKIYISGPISREIERVGYDDVKRRFDNKAYLVFANKDFLAVNPFDICGDNWSWLRCMIVCVRHLVRCDEIYMLKGWKDSRGARIEHAVAKILRMKINYQ